VEAFSNKPNSAFVPPIADLCNACRKLDPSDWTTPIPDVAAQPAGELACLEQPELDANASSATPLGGNAPGAQLALLNLALPVPSRLDPRNVAHARLQSIMLAHAFDGEGNIRLSEHTLRKLLLMKDDLRYIGGLKMEKIVFLREQLSSQEKGLNEMTTRLESTENERDHTQRAKTTSSEERTAAGALRADLRFNYHALVIHRETSKG
jgi:hypothetical protein